MVKLEGVVLVKDADVERMVESDDHLDAFVCALVARAAALNHTAPPTPDVLEFARVEGWIALPTSSLAELS